MAGRFLRRVPILAHARYIATAQAGIQDTASRPRSIERWIHAMERVVEEEQEAKLTIHHAEGHRDATR